MSQKTDKMRQKATKSVRDLKTIELAVAGKSTKEIASELGIHRTTVGRILSGDEMKKIIKEADSRLHGMIFDAINTFKDAIEGRSTDMTNALKAAAPILKSAGVLKDKIDITHTFPKPTIITKRDGSEVILGVKQDDEEYGA